MNGSYRHSRLDRQCHALPPTCIQLHDRYNQPCNDGRGSTPCLSLFPLRCRRHRLRLWTYRYQVRSPPLNLSWLMGSDAGRIVLLSTPESSQERRWTHVRRKLKGMGTMQQGGRVRLQTFVVDS